MKLAFLKLVLFLHWNVECNGLAVTKAVANAATEDLVNLIHNTLENGIQVLVPGIVRLLFHDCVDNCDACINPNLRPNRGLSKTIQALEPLYQKYKESISRADLWALAAKVAVNVGVKNNNNRCGNERCMTPPINIRFRYGRKDCLTSPSHSEDTFFPSPFQNTSVLYPWFSKTFRFKPNNVVAIMGMHTLGKAGAPFNSAWEKNNQDGIGNLYFQRIADPYHNWAQEAIPAESSGLGHDVFKWVSAENDGFALPVDISLIKELDINPETGESSCTYYNCKRARTAGMFNRYANDLSNWARHIQGLFSRMIEKSGTRLRFPA